MFCRKLDDSKRVEPIWSYEDARTGRAPKVVSFYSYKGGMGRTTALAATALLLAQHGKQVLAIDTDLEAPGLASLFFPDGQVRDVKGTVDFFLEPLSMNDTVDISQYLLQVTDPIVIDEIPGSIYVVPAGVVDDGYLQKLGRIDFQDIIPGNMRERVTKLIFNATRMIRDMGSSIDYILLDARSGFHDMSGMITAHLPHGAVLFGRNSRQSWSGLRQVISTLARTQEEPLPLAIVDSMCMPLEEDTQQREAFKSQAYTACCESYYPEVEQALPGIGAADEAHSPIYIPYVSDIDEGHSALF